MATLEQIKNLREQTGCGISDCKEALESADNDFDKAVSFLRKKGISSAAKRADRTTGEGIVASYVHGNGRLAVLVSLRCETDFVARNDKFQELGRDIAMHIAAADPVAVNPADIPQSALEAEREFALSQAGESKKPVAIQEKMIEGKLKKFVEERALMTQAFIKDPNKTITDRVNEAIQELGENITVAEFSRLSI